MFDCVSRRGGRGQALYRIFVRWSCDSLQFPSANLLPARRQQAPVRVRGDPLNFSLDLRAEQAYEADRAGDGQVGATMAITW